MVSTKLAASGNAKSISRAPQCPQDSLVADVLARLQRAGGDAEGEPPGGELRALRNRHANEAMPLHDRVGQAELSRLVGNEGAGLQAPRSDRDVVVRRWKTGHPVEFETVGHRG